MDPIWLLLLLPLASLSGYAFGRRSSERSSGQRVDRLSRSYFRGLNLLLNEQTEKALEIFLEMAQVDSDTVEMQLAVGSLFRRRGEVDRAIRLHEDLFSRPLLSVEQRLQALIELGEDFMRAGLLDRAEELYRQLLEIEPRSEGALRKLIEIFEQENEWQQAIDMAEQLAALGSGEHVRLAHYHCELAERRRAAGDFDGVAQQLELARQAHPQAVRVELLAASIALEQRAAAVAITHLQAAAKVDPEFIPELLPLLERCEADPAARPQAQALLPELIEADRGVGAVLSLGAILRRDHGEVAEREFYSAQLRKRPSIRVLKRMLEVDLPDQERNASPILELSFQVLRSYLDRKPAYRCGNCGFSSGRTLHWQCPSCKSWGMTKPVPGAAGE